MSVGEALCMVMVVMGVRHVGVFMCQFLVRVLVTVFAAKPGGMRVVVVPVCVGVPVFMGHRLMNMRVCVFF